MAALLARLLAVSLAITAGALIVVAFFSPAAQAQSAANGAALYRSFPASCADCHNADPRLDQHRNAASGGVRSGANRPDLILGAITTPGAFTGGNTDMYDLLYPVYIQNQAAWEVMIADIAAYLGQVFPPSAAAGQLKMPGTFAFPDQPVGTVSAPQTLSITNVGGMPVDISSLASSVPSEFAVVSSTCMGALAPSAGCRVDVVFVPSSAGPRTATIQVVSTGAGSPQAFAIGGTGTTAAGLIVAVEFHHAEFDHYFVTTIPDEIAKLASGAFPGWRATGASFNVHPASGAPAGSAIVCRFFSTAFAPRSSHFYTPSATECAGVKNNRDWTFEGEVFHVAAAAADGSCPAHTQPVYRLYNNGQGAAPNHRYTTDATIRSQMLARGWIAEGFGALGVIMCSPQ